MPSLFDSSISKKRPLAELLRPQALSGVLGQDHLVGPQGSLIRMLQEQKLSSLILWGPPGCGKTTIAQLIAHHVTMEFVSLSAVLNGVADLRKIFEKAEKIHEMGSQTLVFVDEIHRFNRAQQDSFLAHMEQGIIVLIGATTENPSFELNSALLSRTQVFIIKRLDTASLEKLIQKAEEHYGQELPLTDEARQALCHLADGDGRTLLTMVESLYIHPQDLSAGPITLPRLETLLQRRPPLYDKSQEGHYNLISALHKCLRGSDPDAALYWLSRMLDGGENPLYILRRLVRFASEDIGLADPQALARAIAAREAYQFLGSPEGELAIAQCVLYLATAPKSNAVYTAFKASFKAAQRSGSLMPPVHILNAPTKMMKEMGYGEDYIYDHDELEGFSGQNYFPPALPRQTYYQPFERGFEREIKKRLQYWEKLRAAKQEAPNKK